MSAANNDVDVAIEARIDNATARVVIQKQEQAIPQARFGLRSVSAPAAARLADGECAILPRSVVLRDYAGQSDRERIRSSRKATAFLEFRRAPKFSPDRAPSRFAKRCRW